MPNRRLSMRKILQTLRLREHLGLTNRQIADVIKASPTTVGDYLRRANLANIVYAAGLEMGHELLEQHLFPPSLPSSVKRPLGLVKLMNSWRTPQDVRVDRDFIRPFARGTH